MKKISYSLIFVLIVHCTLIIDNCMCQWVQKSNGMGTNKTVWSFAVSGNNIFAGTDAGVYLSTNNGELWSLTSLNNQSGNVLLINGNNIYTGTGQGVFLSTNNGQNWTHLGLNNNVWGLAINGSNIFAGTIYGYGVYRSTNNGLNWAQTSLNTAQISSLVISGNDIFAGDWASCSVFRSTDNGNNWTQISLGGSATEVVACLAVNVNNFFAGTINGGVFRSTNYGLNWVVTSLNSVCVVSLTRSNSYIFAGADSYGEVFISSDNGESWILKKQGMSNCSVWSLATSSQYIFAGTDSSVWRRDLSEIIGIQNISSEIPSGFVLYQNYPNPFNPSTKIKFDVAQHTPYPLSRGENVTLKIYDITGREITTLVNKQLNPGTYEVTFDARQPGLGSNLPSGVYFYKLTAENFTNTKKLILLK